MDKELEVRLDKLELAMREMRDFVACLHENLVQHEEPKVAPSVRPAPVSGIKDKPKKKTAAP